MLSSTLFSSGHYSIPDKRITPFTILVQVRYSNGKKTIYETCSVRITMTIELFSNNSYIKTFKAAVKELDPDEKAVVLDQTAFFPGGGGQPCDLGVLTQNGNHFEVIKTVRKNGEIVHLMKDSLPEPGTSIEGTIDWARRYQLMKTHTALHIMCGVIWRDYEAQVTGGNMDPTKGRLDFEIESFSAELVKEIEEKINIEVKASRDIEIQVLPREEAFKIPGLIRTKVNLLPESLMEIRVISIKDLDVQADGGTHVANTSELKSIKITKHKSKGRNNKRIEIAVE
jgi:misacylated tRNA(Ala) deacylase